MTEPTTNPTPEEEKAPEHAEVQSSEPSAEAPAKPAEEKPAVENPKAAVSHDEDHAMDEKLLGALSYVPVFFLLSIFMRPKNEYCRFHARQGLVMTAGFFVVLITMAVSTILRLNAIGTLLFYVYVILVFYLMYLAYSGKKWMVPGLKSFVEKVDLDKLFFAKPSSTPTTQAPPETPPTSEEAPQATSEPSTTEPPTEAPAADTEAEKKEETPPQAPAA